MATRTLAGLVMALVACGSGNSADGPTTIGAGDAPPNGYLLDLSHDEQNDGLAWSFRNESLVFVPDLAARERSFTSDGDTVRKLYNRLPCGSTDRDDETAASFFDSAVGMASRAPVHLDSFSLVMPDMASVQSGLPPTPVSSTCYVVHTADGQWHGYLAPVRTEHDESAALSRLTVQVAMDNVDLVGVVVYSGYVSEVSYVAW